MKELEQIERVKIHGRDEATFLGVFSDLVEVEYRDGNHDTFGKWNFYHAIQRGEVEIIE